MIAVKNINNQVRICNDDLVFVENDIFLTLGVGEADIDMHLGNFFIEDNIIESQDFDIDDTKVENNEILLNFKSKLNEKAQIKIFEEKNLIKIKFVTIPERYNRITVKFKAEKDEAVFGLGEQFSYFNLRGKSFPIFTQEQGVGRNKNTEITQLADKYMRGGGDYYTTFYPQPTFVSSKKYFMHCDTFAYCNFNFENENYHEITFWEAPNEIVVGVSETLIETVKKLSSYLGKQDLLPNWALKGLSLGVQGGSDYIVECTKKAKSLDLDLNSIWIQDWEGVNYTSFGKRLRWDWKWDEELYPNLKNIMCDFDKDNIKVMGYINPYVVNDGTLCKIAKENNYLAKDKDGNDYYVDFGEFNCGIIDFTIDEAYQWYKEVIKENLINFGLAGWMADFGEYLPTDCYLKNGDALVEHNRWPGLWAKLNWEACKESKRDDLVFFMRAGNSMSQKYCKLIWAGDQNVDFTVDDGLPSVITSALSLSMCAMGLHHSDIGGYTTLYTLKRSKELLIRWAEMGAFTAFMRTHEGNRPEVNHQLMSDDETILAFAYLVKVHNKLFDYLSYLNKINHEEGIPIQRPLFFHYDDESFYDIKDQYLLGAQLLVAPQVNEGKYSRKVILPNDNWVHIFTGKEYNKGEFEVDTPCLTPAVFYKKGCEFESLFKEIMDIEKPLISY
ncbi:MAG: alpha-glucosidase [Pleomorphochaeta sp.]